MSESQSGSIALPSALTLREVAQAGLPVLERIDTCTATNGQVHLDASALQGIDSATVAFLLACLRHAQARGLALVLNHAPQRLCAMATMYGVHELLGLPAVQAAPIPMYG